MWKRLCCCALLVALAMGCAAERPTKVPMDLIRDSAPGVGGKRTLFVMLPGVNDSPAAFAEHGFIQVLRDRRLPADVVAADAHLGYYLDRTLIRRIDADIVAPARASGYARIWLVGISLGGMGALQYVRIHPEAVEGAILLSPFLGTTGVIAEVVRAGGLAFWQPGVIAPDDHERALLAWLKTYRPDDPRAPRLHLGYGRSDRFAEADGLLAQRLPQQRVLVVDGGHDWQTWTALWLQLLGQAGFVAEADASRE